ncbi:MAG: hypothetical protein HKM93_16390 [Desulfobacteraceae bacterium]|nr:hypothetical protein [Desulfobacteraceae bacterium]
MPEFDFLSKINIFNQSLAEQIDVLNSFWEKAAKTLSNSDIRLRALPDSWKTLRHNYFSVLFIAMFHALNIPPRRRCLFARLNHCLRCWVTACDNLLDDELKELILTDLPETAPVFKSVLTLLVTDRVFFSYLLDAVDDGIISPAEMHLLNDHSLDSILVSGKEEAQEEGGVDYALSPDEVLDKIHSAKTGQLFTAPLSAPVALGDLDPEAPIVKKAMDGLMQLGIGCQVLDDLSDLAMDIHDRKYNYLAALILHGDDTVEKKQLDRYLSVSLEKSFRNRFDLYTEFPVAAGHALKIALGRLSTAVSLLRGAGLPMDSESRKDFIGHLAELYGQPQALILLRDR